MKEHPIRAIRRAGVPLVAFCTSDPAETVRGCVAGLNGKAETVSLMGWDICNGLVGLNQIGKEVVMEIAPDGPIQTGNPTECLALLASRCPEDAIVFVHGAGRILDNGSVIQALWNLRDILKARHATVCLLTSGQALPDELKNDVVVIREPLPARQDIERIVDSICADAGLTVDSGVKDKALDALLGLSGFAAEQCLAMSCRPDGIDLAGLWERKRQMIEQTPGLSVWRGVETFHDIGGCHTVKGFLAGVMTGKRAPRAICFIDEIEKSLGGQGDTSGVSQDYLGQLLTFMQDKQAAGCIFIGPPGAAKSAVAKAAGNEAGIPTIQLDFGGMKGSLVGQSEQRLRAALGVVEAVSQGQTLFIATCNSFGNLPPELKRRFTLGTFFFDLPTADEREAIWTLYNAKFELQGIKVADEGWTGAEIRQCCEIAWRLGISQVEAAKFVVPVAKSAADQIDALRKQASGKFISAATSGLYRFEPQAATGGRRFGDN